MSDLRGKVAFVTGGSRGIGLAIARALVAAGAQVSVTGRDERHLSTAKSLIGSSVVMLRLQPSAIEPASSDVSSYTYNDHVPLGLVPLKTDKAVPYGPDGVGGGIRSAGG